MIKSFSIQKSSSKPPNVFVAPALKSPTKQIFGHCSSSHNCLNLPRDAKNSSVLDLLRYGRYTLIKHNSDFFKNALVPIIEPSQFEKDEFVSGYVTFYQVIVSGYVTFYKVNKFFVYSVYFF